MPTVLFICSANMCRSPMAEALFMNLFGRGTGNLDWHAASAGVWAMDGNRASDGAVRAMLRRGIDITKHRARSITRAMIEEANLILTMERNHKEALQAVFPRERHKIFMLTEMVGLSYDVRDPIGGGLADYDDTADELQHLLMDGMEQIQSLVINQMGEEEE